MIIERLTPQYDTALAELIRNILKAHSLDIPGTVYFDEGLDHLSTFYGEHPEKRAYFIMLDAAGQLIGGIGLAEFELFDNCAELQKLYLAESARGQRLGYQMISMVEEEARRLGYSRMYLETHNNLPAAIHIYEKAGYEEIERPKNVVHTTMNRFYIKKL